MAHNLADFDPIKAKEILESCTHQEIVRAFRSKVAYNRYEEK